MSKTVWIELPEDMAAAFKAHFAEFWGGVKLGAETAIDIFSPRLSEQSREVLWQIVAVVARATTRSAPASRTLAEWAKACHEVAVDRGWWQAPSHFDARLWTRKELAQKLFGDKIALIHSELSEALEDYRLMKPGDDFTVIHFEGSKPVGLASELADIVIRLFDLTEALGIDIETAIMVKHEYNKTRSFRHGGKAI
jgi:NTP pyrophosphatase (non-canonical NTP hydrolase)